MSKELMTMKLGKLSMQAMAGLVCEDRGLHRSNVSNAHHGKSTQRSFPVHNKELIKYYTSLNLGAGQCIVEASSWHDFNPLSARLPYIEAEKMIVSTTCKRLSHCSRPTWL